MKNQSTTQESAECRWDAIILRQELRQLKREQRYLSSKHRSGALTAWEVSRLDQILDEMMQLLPLFGSLAVSGENQH